MASTSISDCLLAEQVRLVLQSSQTTGWTVHTDGFWCYVQPPGHQPREQGWKLHVSATPLSTVVITVRSAEVLVRAGCAFKVAAGLPQLHQLEAEAMRFLAELGVDAGWLQVLGGWRAWRG
jgi:hypothetical protein